MGILPDTVRSFEDALRHLEVHATRPIDLESALRQLLERHPEAEEAAGDCWYWEIAAGALIHSQEGEGNPWKLDFGPILQGQSESGELLTHPRLDKLNLSTIGYWRQRAWSTANPVLGAHYADLAWSLASQLGVSKDVEDVRRAIDAYVEASRIDSEAREVDAIQGLRRAMELSLLVKDPTRQATVKDAMFALARRLEGRPFPLHRSFLLDAFGLGPFSKVVLTASDQAYMVRLLEEVLERETTAPDPEVVASVWDAENAAQLLAAYYRKISRPDEVRRVLETFGALVHRRSGKAQPMVGQTWLEGYSRLAKEHGQTDLETQAIRALQAMGPDVIKELKAVGGSVEISEEQVEAIVQDFVRGDLGDDLCRLAGGLVPAWEEVVNFTHEAAKMAPLQSLVSKAILDHSGRPTLYLPSFSTNPIPHYPTAYAQRVQLDGFFRRMVLAAIHDTHKPSAKDLVDWMVQTPAYTEDRRGFLECGIEAFLRGDYTTSIHVLLPQIEEALRRLGGLVGDRVLTWVESPDGVRRLDARSLHAVLEGPHLISLLGPNLISFLKATLVLPEGLNLRNRMAHGLLYPEECTQSVADVVFQALLIPCLVQRTVPPPGSGQ